VIYRSKVPLRLGFGGGGTDLDVYCNKYKGFVLNATISLFIHCTIEETFDDKIVFESLDMDQYLEVDSKMNLISDGTMPLYVEIYNTIVDKYINRPLSFKLTTYSDAPNGSGLGGSSTLVVAIIKAFIEWLNIPLGEYDIARLAIKIERDKLNMIGGSQDQYAATFGGFNFMEFDKEHRVIVNPLRIKNWIKNEFEESLVLYFTGITRKSGQIEEEKKALIKSKNSLSAMHKVKESAVLMKESLLKGNVQEFSKILSDSWMAKRQTSSMISNREIDHVFSIAMRFGAYSGKVSGAGGGGFVFFIVDPRKKLQLKRELNKQKGEVYDFTFVNNGASSWSIK
jgi:D-glycero-alpha-D-manno-heptose-7-phosphate kinase